MSIEYIEEMVRNLVHEHFDIEESIERIVWFKDGRTKEIHLLEVNRDAIQEELIITFFHAPTEDFPMPSIVADVTPEEWEKVKNGSIHLPEGWILDNIEIFERADFWQKTSAGGIPE